MQIPHIPETSNALTAAPLHGLKFDEATAPLAANATAADQVSAGATESATADYHAAGQAEPGGMVTQDQSEFLQYRQLNANALAGNEAKFRQQIATDFLMITRGMVHPSHSIHEQIEEVQQRARILRHARLQNQFGAKTNGNRANGTAGISHAPASKSLRFELLHLAQQLAKSEKNYQRLIKEQSLQASHVAKLSPQQIQRELNLRGSLSPRDNLRPDVLARLGIAHTNEVDALRARVSAIVDHVLQNGLSPHEFRDVAPILPQLLNVLPDARSRQALFNTMRWHAQGVHGRAYGQAMLVNLTRALPTLMNPQVQRDQLRALGSTKKPSRPLLQALLESTDNVREGEDRDDAIYRLALQHAQAPQAPLFTFKQKIDSMVDRTLQQKALEFLIGPTRNQ